MTRTIMIAWCSLLGFWAGCTSDPVNSVPVIPVPSARGVYIVNEGNFGRGNSSLSYLDLTTFQVYNDVFTAVNGKNLGDVGTGMVLQGSRGYIIVNNSSKIEIIDLRTNRELGVIATGAGSSPRRLVLVNDTMALVTDLYQNRVGLVDLKGLQVVSWVNVGANPDGITVAEGRAFVANSGLGTGNSVSVVDLGGLTGTTDLSKVALTVSTTIHVGDSPGGVQLTPFGMVYVVCAGSYGDGVNPATVTPAKIFVIDPGTLSVTDSVMIGDHAFDIAISDIDGIGYTATSDSVFRIDTRTHRKTSVFLAGSYYAVGIEQVSGDVYLADPRNYVEPGTIDVYSASGQQRMAFNVGIIPGWFAFVRQ